MGKSSKEVDAYIAKAPMSARPKLTRLRNLIKELAPDAEEGISYKMPSYGKGKVAWFAMMNNYIGLYIRPPIIEEHRDDLKDYKTTKSAVHILLDRPLPVHLIKKLISARIRKNGQKTKKRA